MNTVKKLLSFSFDIISPNIADENILKHFEKNILYKQCFSQARDINLVTSLQTSDLTFVAKYHNMIIGLIQVVQTSITPFVHECKKNSSIIVNFCIDKKFRSYGLGTNMLSTVKHVCKHRNIPLYICINKKEPLNDEISLFRFYSRFGFQKVLEPCDFILLELKT